MSNKLWGNIDRVDPLQKLTTYWRTEIKNAKSTEFPLQNIDEVVLNFINVHAHLTTMAENFKTKKSLLEVTRRGTCKTFLSGHWPLFTCDMPMLIQILNSQHDIVKQKWIFSTIAKFSGYFKWPKMCTIYIIKELSHIR